MMVYMKRKWLGLCCRWVAIVVLVLSPAAALARSDEPDVEPVDARLEGYGTSITLPASSVGLTWVALIFLGVVTCIGLFKDAKRTHLD